MARLPYVDFNNPELSGLVGRIIKERGSVLHLYQMLLHSPAVAEGWLTFLTAIRQRTRLPGGLRELVIMRVAMLNGASYEADQHAPIASREGVTACQLAHLRDWHTHIAIYSDAQRVALALTDAMTRDVQVPDLIWEALHVNYTPQVIVELIATIAAYNMVSRFLEAIQIHSDDRRL